MAPQNVRKWAVAEIERLLLEFVFLMTVRNLKPNFIGTKRTGLGKSN